MDNNYSPHKQTPQPYADTHIMCWQQIIDFWRAPLSYSVK